MCKGLVVVALIIVFVFIFTPAQAGFNTTPDTYVVRSYNYVLDGRPGILSLALSTNVYQDYLKKETLWDIQENRSHFLFYVNDPVQAPYIKTLADEIRARSADPDDQARIAANLVQHITYSPGNRTRFPYEVLYEGKGVCGEKSTLLAALLRELGFGSSIFYFLSLNHMTTGINCPVPYDFQGSGYCMIESTATSIITDETVVMDLNHTSWSNPEIIKVSDGNSLENAGNDYYDARSLIILKSEYKEAREAGETLSSKDYQRWYRLNTKYDLF